MTGDDIRRPEILGVLAVRTRRTNLAPAAALRTARDLDGEGCSPDVPALARRQPCGVPNLRGHRPGAGGRWLFRAIIAGLVPRRAVAWQATQPAARPPPSWC
jgi:hypothetical protein